MSQSTSSTSSRGIALGVRQPSTRARLGLVPERGLRRRCRARRRHPHASRQMATTRAPSRRHQPREVRARVAEAVDGDARVCAGRCPRTRHASRSGVEAAARRRLAAPLRAAERDGLARHHAQLGVAAHHRDGVHDPRHRLLVGVDVGRGDVAVGADDGRDLEGVAARQTLQLALATSTSGRRPRRPCRRRKGCRRSHTSTSSRRRAPSPRRA